MSLHQRRGSRAFRAELGEWLRTSRQQRGLSQEQLAWEADITQASISNYEAGRHEIPVSIFVALCRALGMDPGELLHILTDRHIRAVDGPMRT